MVTTKEKPEVDAQKTMIKDSNHNTMKSHQITKEDRKEEARNKVSTNSWKTMSYMALISSYLFIIMT